MNDKYPKNFIEGIVLGIVNCGIMVSGMMSFNLFRNGALTLENFLSGFLPIFLFAFLLSEILVGPLMMKVVSKFVSNKYLVFFRVLLMAMIMTFMAPLIEMGFVMNGAQFLYAFITNYFVALVLQTMIAMRCALFVLAEYRSLYNNH